MIDYYKKTEKVIRRIDKLEQKQFMTHKQRYWNRYKISKLRSRFNLYTKLNVKQLQDAKLNNYTALVNDISGGTMKRFILYLIRWQLSTPILWGCMLAFVELSKLNATIIANLIGGMIFFWVDKYLIFKGDK